MFSDILKMLREEVGLTQKELGEKLNLSTSTIGMYESGQRFPDAPKLNLIADYFKVSTDFLLERDKHRNPSSIAKDPSILSKKDEKDVSKKLEEIKDTLESQSGLLFSGNAMDEETREFLLASLERTIRQSKVLAKEKFTPNKYKK